MQRTYRVSTRLTSIAIALIGLTMVASTIARGGGPLALGVVLGVLFTLLGAGRAWLAGPGERHRA